MAQLTYTIGLPDIVKSWAKEYNTTDFISQDPVQFPHKWEHKRDIEISAFITSWLSYGNRKAISQVSNQVNDLFIQAGTPFKFIDQFGRFKWENDKPLYRFYKWGDLRAICEVLYRIYSDYVFMEDMVLDYSRDFPDNENKYLQAIIEYFRFYGKDVKGVPSTSESACKRLSMFLRWMVRRDGIVDLGVWDRIDPKDLIIPLDTHVHQVAIALDITQRKQADMRTATEITNYFKGIFPEDPALGDFALFGAGVNANPYK